MRRGGRVGGALSEFQGKKGRKRGVSAGPWATRAGKRQNGPGGGGGGNGKSFGWGREGWTKLVRRAGRRTKRWSGKLLGLAKCSEGGVANALGKKTSLLGTSDWLGEGVIRGGEGVGRRWKKNTKRGGLHQINHFSWVVIFEWNPVVGKPQKKGLKSSN